MRKEGGLDIVRNHNNKGHNIRNRVFLLLAVMLVGYMGTGVMAAHAADGTEGNLCSTGRVQYEGAVFDSADLRDIRAYIDEKKCSAAQALIRLGTRFRQQPEGCAYDRNPDAGPEEIDAGQLTWEMLARAAAESQTVPSALSVLNPEAALHIEGVEERTEHYETAVEDNISRGRAAWADGRLLLGNGADNDKAYHKGTEDGRDGRVPENYYPVYTAEGSSVEIRHVHVGTAEEKEGISGCYNNFYTTKEKVVTCNKELVKTEATWYPNPDEPDGGSWHGGEYTCSLHGELYLQPGKCPHQDKKKVKEWEHELICGLEESLYGKLTVRGTDTDYFDRAIVLEAVVEECDGYDHQPWQDSAAFVWTDTDGNVIGTGSEYTACEAGVYHCRIDGANTGMGDTDASVTVRKTGLVMRGN